MASQFNESHAKALVTGIKAVLRDYPPLVSAEISVALVGEDGTPFNIRMTGVPPFTISEVVIDGRYVGAFLGHPETES